MAKKKPDIKMRSYGVYTPFEHTGEALPRITEFTTRVPVRPGIEFGYVLQIRKARGMWLRWRIEHPPFTDEDGNVQPPFEGRERIPTPDYRFFIGDTVWEPLADMVGTWKITTWVGDEQAGAKTFQLVPDTE